MALLSFAFASCTKDDQCVPILKNPNSQNETEKETVHNPNIVTLKFNEVVSVNLPSSSSSRTLGLDQANAHTKLSNGDDYQYQKPQLHWSVGDRYRIYACVRYKDTENADNWRPNYGTMEAEVIEVSDDKLTDKFKLKGSINFKKSNLDLTDPNNPKLKDDQDNWYFMALLGGKLDNDGNLVDDLGVTPTPDVADNYSNPADFNSGDIKGIAFKSSDRFIVIHPKDKSFNLNVPFAISPTAIKITSNGVYVQTGIISCEVKPKNSEKPFNIRPIGNVLCLKIINPHPTVSGSIKWDESALNIKSKYLLKSKIYFDFWHEKDYLGNMGTKDWSWHYQVGDIDGNTPNTNSILTENGYRKGDDNPTRDVEGDFKEYCRVVTDWDQFIKSPNSVAGGKPMYFKDNQFLKKMINFFGVEDEGNPEKGTPYSANTYIWSIYNKLYGPAINEESDLLINLHELNSTFENKRIINKKIAPDRAKVGSALTINVSLYDKI